MMHVFLTFNERESKDVMRRSKQVVTALSDCQTAAWTDSWTVSMEHKASCPRQHLCMFLSGSHFSLAIITNMTFSSCLNNNSLTWTISRTATTLTSARRSWSKSPRTMAWDAMDSGTKVTKVCRQDGALEDSPWGR